MSFSPHILSVLAGLCALLPAAARAEMFGKDYQPCGDRPDTATITACIGNKARAWDRRLNTAYQALESTIDPEQREPLKAAQRLWIQYRDANCRFYAAHSGSISSILAAECTRAMTQDRTLELEQAAKP
jgi:uncharacterized protein YecT (DUF1311 family)